MNEIKDINQLKDMIISAVRYALGRHTYIVSETIDFIQSNCFLIDKRVKSVIMNDLKYWMQEQKNITDIDYNDWAWACFCDWLNDYEPKEEKINIVNI